MTMPYLSISGVGIEYVREKLGGNSDTGDDQSMHIERVDNKGPSGRFADKLTHPIKVYQQGEEHLVGSWTIFQNTKEISLKGDCRDVSGMKREGRCRCSQ